jgi:hypothetical protein
LTAFVKISDPFTFGERLSINDFDSLSVFLTSSTFAFVFIPVLEEASYCIYLPG